MAIVTHVASLNLFQVDTNTGEVYQRGRAPGRAIKQNLNFDTQHRIVVDPDIPNTAGNPTIKDYLVLEAGDDFEPVQIFQSLVITKMNDGS